MGEEDAAPRHIARGETSRRPGDRRATALEQRLPGILFALTIVALVSLWASLDARSAATDARDLSADGVVAAEEGEAEVLQNRQNGYSTRAGICEIIILDDDRDPAGALPSYCTTPEVAVHYSPLLCSVRPQHCAVRATTTSTTAGTPPGSGPTPPG